MPTKDKLIAEAKRMATSLPPELLIPWADGNPVYTPELAAEIKTREEARDALERQLAELAGWDGVALRDAHGPPTDRRKAQWQWLLVGAALKSERRNLPVDQVAVKVANMALFGAEVDPQHDWSETHAKHARTSIEPAESLRRALEVLPLEARRRRVPLSAVVEEAKARLTRALEQIVSD